MKKVLFTANLESFLIKFLIPQLKYYKEKGYEVHIAAKSQNIDIPYCDKKYDINFARGFSFKIVDAYKQIKKVIEENDYELISCHTPFGAAIPRLAIRNIKNLKSKVVYTAHGFHFFKGAPLKNWMIYYTAEKYLAKYTDSIITINKEDYNITKNKMKTKSYYVPGIGIDKEKFDVKITEKEKKKLYKELGVDDSNFIMIFPGEINNNKNQKLLIDTTKILKEKISNVVLLLPGNDLTKGKLEKYAIDNGISECVRFLGFRNDVPKLLRIANISLSSSKREGLPINLIEAMHVGLPIVATNCRGNRDLIEDNKGGFLVYKNSPKEFAEKILKIYKNPTLGKKFVTYNKKKSKEYLLDNVLKKIVKIYEE